MSSIIITGACSGIGLAITKYFASSSSSSKRTAIAMLDVNAERGPEVAEQVQREFPYARITFRLCDVGSWEDQADVFRGLCQEQEGPESKGGFFEGRGVDVVVANAGVSEQGKTTLVGHGDTEGDGPVKPKVGVLEINLLGVIYSVNLAVHYMNHKPKEIKHKGLIICTASNAGLYPLPTAPLYAASKAGVIGLVRSTAQLIESKGIRINALAPAVLETNIAPSKDLFKHMIVTPMETLIKGVDRFVHDDTLSGAVAEIHGDKVTLRPPHEFVDEDTKKNIEMFWALGYA